MLSARKSKSIVGLDIEAGSAAATELRSDGAVEVLGHGVMSLEAGTFADGEVRDAQALGEALKELFARHKLSRNVRLGIANQRVTVRVLRLPELDGDELESAIRFQAQDQIPMPLDQAVLDWQVINRAAGDGAHAHIDVVVVAARRDMLAAMLDALRRAGLRPLGIDHSAFGMIRALSASRNGADGAAGSDAADLPPTAALVPESTVAGEEGAGRGAGRLYCNLADATNLAVARDGACLFTRISPLGVDSIAQRLAERQQLSLDEAHHWLVRVGLEAEPETIDGEPERIAAARETLDEGATKLADELRMSLDFYSAQDGAIPVDSVVACGWGTTIPGLVARLEQEVGRPFEVTRPSALDGLDEATAARVTLPYGIALEE